MRRFIRMIIVAAVVAAMGAMAAVPACAEDFTSSGPGRRSETWDFLLSAVYAETATIEGKGGASADLNDDWGFAFGVGYNFNDHIQLNGLINFTSRSYDATVVGDDGTSSQYSNYMESSTLGLNGVYYLLSNRITPFVSGGIGYTWVDTNIQDGPPSDTCWYDPWYGYICNSYVPTKTESDFSYNAGIGLRLDVSREFGFQAGYYKTWIDIDNASSTPDFDTWRLDVILRFGD